MPLDHKGRYQEFTQRHKEYVKSMGNIQMQLSIQSKAKSYIDIMQKQHVGDRLKRNQKPEAKTDKYYEALADKIVMWGKIFQEQLIKTINKRSV